MTEEYVVTLQENIKKAHQVAKEKLKTTLKQRKRMMHCRDREIPAWITVYKNRSTADESAGYHDAKTEYCVCQKPCNGRFMTQCDYCDEWYHGSCVNISATDALNIDMYKCIRCGGMEGKRRLLKRVEDLESRHCLYEPAKAFVTQSGTHLNDPKELKSVVRRMITVAKDILRKGDKSWATQNWLVCVATCLHEFELLDANWMDSEFHHKI
ncbi:lysine-specific demethylase 7A-like [Ylistrum balloti]|uniref:lysine-specific demethylase 7A-like n=1 Tax=Ylistrum balloti TaxID=509963 RepID=UPI002905F1B3|nr:lysine-specific demethylase 7A-like [Ylistrum balloti]